MALTPQSAGDVGVRIERGACRVFVAFDVGNAIDLDAAEAALTAVAPSRETLSQRRRNPVSLQFRPAPVQVTLPIEPLPVCAQSSWRSTGEVECTLFDFGAISVAYRIDLAGVALDDLPRLAADLYESASLSADARARVERLVNSLGPSVSRASVSAVAEDYAVYELCALRHQGGDDLAALDRHAPVLASILRAADEPLGRDEIDDALSCRACYGARDAVWIDWNAAMVLDSAAADTIAVLEFANVQLLEMRFIDDRLDGVLDRSYHVIAVGSAQPFLQRNRDKERRRLAALQIDSVMLFEGVSNAVKLVGDQFLARVYRLAARRFHLPEWETSITRKLDTVQSLYEKLADDQANRRMEVLEWIIILLFVVSIVLPFVVGGGK